MNTQYLIYALIAVGIFTAYMAIVNLFKQDRRRGRIESAVQIYANQSADVKTPVMAEICQSVLAVMRVDIRGHKDIANALAQAGFPSVHAVTYFLFFKRVVQPILLVLAALVLWKMLVGGQVRGLNKALYLLLLSLLAVIGMYGTNLFLSNLKQRRQSVLLESFPETLDLLLVCIEAGLGLDAALGRVCNELRHSSPIMNYEMERTRVELGVLNDRTQALQNLADRTGIQPIKSLVSSLVQSEKFGTSLQETLRVLSEEQRLARLVNAEARAARIPVLITIPLIFCIMPAFLMVILGPPAIMVIKQGGIMGH